MPFAMKFRCTVEASKKKSSFVKEQNEIYICLLKSTTRLIAHQQTQYFKMEFFPENFDDTLIYKQMMPQRLIPR
jgi:hypothetical protein